MTVVVIAPPLSPEAAERTTGSALLAEHTAACEKAGFTTTHINVKGAWVGGGEPKLVLAQAVYDTPHQSNIPYHVDFMKDAAALLVVFRVAADEATKVDEYYGVMVDQPRYANANMESREVPAGLLEGEEAPAAGALRELIRETGSRTLSRMLGAVDPKTIPELFCPTYQMQHVTQRQHQFAIELNVTRKELSKIDRELKRTIGGEAAEKERTIPGVMPIQELWLQNTIGPGIPSVGKHLARFMLTRGIPFPALGGGAGF